STFVAMPVAGPSSASPCLTRVPPRPGVAMPIPAECPLCGHKGVLPDQFQGKQIKCPECCNEFLAGDPVPAKTAGSHPGSAKPGDSGQGNQKLKPAGGSAPGNQVVRPAFGSAQGNQVIKPTGGSAPGNQVIRPTGPSAQGIQKIKPSGSAPGNQVIK